MKKFLILTAAAVAVFASCAKTIDHTRNTGPGTPVGFGVYAGNVPTKVTAITTDNLSSFGVYASYSDGAEWATTGTMNFMFDQEVTGSHAGGFTYTPVKYWPNETTDRLSFWAYAPFKSAANGITENTTNTTAGYPKITYTLPTDANQVDLLWATPQMNKVNNSAYTSGTANPSAGDATISNKVVLTFHHALALLDVQARYLVDLVNEGGTAGAADASTTVTINSISLSGSFPASGVLNLNDGTWSNQADAAATEFERTFTTPKVVTNANASIIDANEQMMVIPKSEGATEITVTVDYDVTTTDNKLSGSKSVVNNVLTSKGNITIQGGKKYKLILVLGLTSVKLDVAVENWVDATGDPTEIDLPRNYAS